MSQFRIGLKIVLVITAADSKTPALIYYIENCIFTKTVVNVFVNKFIRYIVHLLSKFDHRWVKN